MALRIILVGFLTFFKVNTYAQPNLNLKVIRNTYRIPEIGYVVVNAAAVLDMKIEGQKKDGGIPAALTDRFRIGSNTKAITGLIAARLIAQHLINWNDRVIDILPDWKDHCRKEYRKLTLLDLLSFRAPFYSYTYTDSLPLVAQFSGDAPSQRTAFAQYFLQQPPVAKKGVHFSNIGYVVAAEMLQRASGKSYEMLVADLNADLGTSFSFGNPNQNDSTQTWGHFSDLRAEAPSENQKLNWLMAAGNINCTMPDYAHFLQWQLRSLDGGSALLSEKETRNLLFGRKRFAVGWFWKRDAKSGRCAYNKGNPGTFLSKVMLFEKQHLAIAVFCNVQSAEAENGIDAVIKLLQQQYLR
ncbi:MAG: serine hydrolase domain-containing protein [Chitinophagales bacterium]